MNQVTKITSHELAKPHKIDISFAGEYHTKSYKGVTSIGFSVEEENLLLLYKGDTELPSVIINVNHTKSIEITEE